MITCPGHGHNLDIFHVDPTACPEASVTTNVHTADLLASLARQEAHHVWLVSEAAALGVRPEARMAWELVHEAAGIKARTESRLQQLRWTA